MNKAIAMEIEASHSSR